MDYFLLDKSVIWMNVRRCLNEFSRTKKNPPKTTKNTPTHPKKIPPNCLTTADVFRKLEEFK